ncbi:MAG: hypothetical protein ACFFDF_17440 [Candidatus Odinarchaeota archaeon]
MSTNFLEEINQKNLNKREKDFVNRLIMKGGQFTNKDLANLWGTKTFPNNFKTLLLNNPPILELIKERPQTYILKKSEKKFSQTLGKTESTEFSPEYSDLRNEFYKFKETTSKNFKLIFQEINNLKNTIHSSKSNIIQKAHEMEISELEKEIYIIYNQLKNRPHQPIKIEAIWNQLYNKHPTYKWEIFAAQILKIHSKNFHLEEGMAGRHIYDPINNKKYGYVIGNW